MPKLIENAKETLILEGRKFLLEKSYSELNIRELAKICDIGTGTFYNYFKTKDALVSAIFQDDWFKVINIIDTLYEDPLPIKNKFKIIYEAMEEFLDRYISIFYEISLTKNYPEHNNHGFDILYQKAEDLINIEKQKVPFHSILSSKELAILILSSLIYLCKTKYTSFDNLYDSLVI
jgi:AcrR family transcriptional regulator